MNIVGASDFQRDYFTKFKNQTSCNQIKPTNSNYIVWVTEVRSF